MSEISASLFFRIFGDGQAPGVEGQQYSGPLDRRVLVALARHIRPRVCVEFGVQRGITAALLLRELPDLALYCGVDVPPDFKVALPGQAPEVPAAGAAGELARHDPRFQLVLSPTGTAGLTLRDLPPADFFYIDDDHTRAGVLCATGLARGLCRPGGVIAWHDYGNNTVGVAQAIDEINYAEGDHICHVRDSWVCFEFRR